VGALHRLVDMRHLHIGVATSGLAVVPAPPRGSARGETNVSDFIAYLGWLLGRRSPDATWNGAQKRPGC
jgi:hypothetical protein